MILVKVIIALAGASGFARLSNALVLGHEHRHGLKHGKFHSERAVPEGVEVITVCDLGGIILSETECLADIQKGIIKYADGNSIISSAAAPATTVLSVSSAAASQALFPTSQQPVASSSNPVPSAAPPSTYSSSAPAPSSAAAYSSAPSASNPASPSASGLDVNFPSGSIKCTEFPSDYGPMPLYNQGLGGWIGIQAPQEIASDGGLDDIETMVADLCTDGNCCQEGNYCSYACPPGYQKSQWPRAQGETGQSVGGLQCQNGYLTLTNPDYQTLCIPGVDVVTVKVENKLPGNASICRTDYPGTEGMYIPLGTVAGESYPLTVPDGETYYHWEGKPTSAQYYVNNPNVSPEDGCTWGDGSEPVGNWAPLVIGAGYSGGLAWLSLEPNTPTTHANLDFAVEIVGDNVSSKCRYSNGLYCGGANYEDCGTSGCTVSVVSGNVSYVLSPA